MAQDTLPPFLRIVRKSRRGGDGPNRAGDGPNLTAVEDGGTVPLGGRQPGDGPDYSAQDAAPSADAATRPRRAATGLSTDDIVRMFTPKPAPIPEERAEVADSIEPKPTIPVPRLPGRAPGDFEPSRVPVIGKARSLPAPGEEEGNDSRVRDRIGTAGGFDEGGGGATVTRSRVTDPTGHLDEQIDYERQHPAEDGNGWFKSMLKHGGQGVLEGLMRGGVPGAIMGGLGGAVAGAVDQSSDERYDQQRRVGRYQRQRGELVQREGEQLKLDDARAGVRLKNAQAGYAERRPELEVAKADERRLKDERARIFRVLGSLKGQQLDPADPRIKQLQADADRADIPFDVESFNASKGNVIRYTRTDAEHPERTVEVERNVVTGEETVLGQRGFQATRGADGRTTAEVKSDEDRDRGFAANERQRAVSNELRRAGLALSGQRLDLSRAEFDNRLSEQTRREVGQANKLAADAERYERAGNDIGSRTMYKDPETGKMLESRKALNKRDEYLDRAKALRRQLFGSYGYLWSPSDGAAPTITEAEYRKLFPSVSNPKGEAQEFGLTLTDGSAPASGGPLRRSAPRAASPGASGGSLPPVTHRMSRDTFRKNNPQYAKASDAEVDAVLRQNGVQGY